MLLLAVGVRNERRGQLGAALSGDDRVVVVRLGDKQRCAVGLATTLDRATRELVKLNAAVVVNPADSALVAYENLVLGKLEVARQAVSTPNRPDGCARQSRDSHDAPCARTQRHHPFRRSSMPSQSLYHGRDGDVIR